MKFRPVFLLTLGLAAIFPCRVAAQGIPEPSLVIYGTIRNSADNNLRVTFGTLTWQYRNASSGRIVMMTTPITNVLGQFSFVLEVPCETAVGPTVSSNALRLEPTGFTFDRSVVSAGTNTAFFVVPAQATTFISSTNRGRIERVDLTVNISFEDSNNNGMPDDWERHFFSGLGIEPPNGDRDMDGLLNIDEYRAGTDPTDPSSSFRFVNALRQPPNGFRVEWSSVEGRTYAVERSVTPLAAGFSTIASNLVATPPVNVHLDPAATGNGPFFYRLRLQ